MFFDPLYIVFALPALILSLTASGLLNYWYGKYSGRQNSNNYTGEQVASMIAEANGLHVAISAQQGKLTDNYDPRNETVNLSADVYQRPSIASVAIAAHEMGHVMQYQSGSLLMRFRSFLVPAVNFGTNIGYFMIIFGFILAASPLVWLGIVFFSLSTFFTLFTLPIEFDASIRGLQAIEKLNLLPPSEMGGAKKVLFAAALTYVAGAVASTGNLLYFILRAQGMNRD